LGKKRITGPLPVKTCTIYSQRFYSGTTAGRKPGSVGKWQLN